MTIAVRDEPPSDTQAKPFLIDTDVHEVMHDFDECLVPYLDKEWQQVMKEWRWRNKGKLAPDASPYITPTGGGRREWLNADGRTSGTDVDAMRQHLFVDEGVSIAILTGMFHPSAMVGSYEFALALNAAYNDYQIEQWLEKDPRFRGSVHVVAHVPDLAVREIDRISEHPQIVQVFLPLVVDRQYGDPFYWPIFEAAAKHGLAVAFHHGAHTQTGFGYPRYWLEWHMTAPPHATHLQLTSLICNGVFDRYPDLKVVALESGVAWVPWFMWRLDEQYKESRSEVPWVKRLPSEHFRDNIRVATQPMGDMTADRLQRLVDLCETDRIYAFATDYPHYDADSADAVLAPSLPGELRERIWFRNALDAYARIELPA